MWRSLLTAMFVWQGAGAVAAEDCGLPDRSSEAVLTLDVVDAAAPRARPLITFLADGQIEVRAPQQSSLPLVARMDRADLASLIAYVIDTERFDSIDTAAIAAAVAVPPPGQTGIFVNVLADAPTSFLTLSLAGCANSVSVEGSAVRSRQRGDIDALQRFRRIEVRLLEIATQIQLRQ